VTLPVMEVLSLNSELELDKDLSFAESELDAGSRWMVNCTESSLNYKMMSACLT